LLELLLLPPQAASSGTAAAPATAAPAPRSTVRRCTPVVAGSGTALSQFASSVTVFSSDEMWPLGGCLVTTTLGTPAAGSTH
jgi:hypothetical protein